MSLAEILKNLGPKHSDLIEVYDPIYDCNKAVDVVDGESYDKAIKVIEILAGALEFYGQGQHLNHLDHDVVGIGGGPRYGWVQVDDGTWAREALAKGWSMIVAARRLGWRVVDFYAVRRRDYRVRLACERQRQENFERSRRDIDSVPKPKKKRPPTSDTVIQHVVASHLEEIPQLAGLPFGQVNAQQS